MKDRKQDFSVYRNNENIIYLDYAATTFMPDQVINSWVDYQQNIGVGCNRGDGILSEMAQIEYGSSKTKILKFFDADENYALIFGKNATECLNLMAYSLQAGVSQGDIILMGPYEHHSNILPWEKVAKHTGACLVQLPLLENGTINYDFVDSLDKKRIRVISISSVSNVNAYALDLLWLKKLKIECDAMTILDVSQAVGHSKVSCRNIDADAYVMSAHKMYGPKNIGAVIVKKEKLESMEPFLIGGGMVWNSLGAIPKWYVGVRKFEAGTFDVGLVKAWAEACNYLNSIGMDNVRESDKKIWTYVKSRMKQDHFTIISGGNENASIVSFVVKNLHPHDVAEIAAINNFEIRAGHMCAQGALDNLGVTSLCRLSWGIGSDIEDIKSFVELIEGEL